MGATHAGAKLPKGAPINDGKSYKELQLQQATLQHLSAAITPYDTRTNTTHT
jgi:hypothetical protein